MLDTRKSILAAVLGGLVLLAGGVAIGRYTTPTKIVEAKSHSETTIRLQNIEQKVDLTELAKLVQDIIAKQQKDVHVKKTVQTNADGSSLTTEETIDKSTSETSSHTASETSKVDRSTTSTTLLDEKLTLDQSFKSAQTAGVGRDNWLLGVTATYQPFSSPPGFNLVPNDRLQVSAEIAYRLFGPFWVGAVLTSNLSFGATVKTTWR